MKKLVFLAGIGAGFVLGSRSGRRPYEQLETKVREMSGKPAVRHAVDHVGATVREHADTVKEKVAERLPSANAAAQHAAAQARA